MKLLGALKAAKKFLEEEAGYPSSSIASAEPLEEGKKWRVIAEAGVAGIARKELIIDDETEVVLNYRELPDGDS